MVSALVCLCPNLTLDTLILKSTFSIAKKIELDTRRSYPPFLGPTLDCLTQMQKWSSIVLKWCIEELQKCIMRWQELVRYPKKLLKVFWSHSPNLENHEAPTIKSRNWS